MTAVSRSTSAYWYMCHFASCCDPGQSVSGSSRN